MNFRNYLLRICRSLASPERTQGSTFHDSDSYYFLNHSRSWVIFFASQRFLVPLSCRVAKAAGWNQIPDGLSAYDASTARFRHMALVRSYLGVTRFSDAARKLMLRFCLASSRVREDLADIVNMAIEELVLSLISKKEPLNSGSKISERFLDKIPLSFWSVVKNMRP